MKTNIFILFMLLVLSACKNSEKVDILSKSTINDVKTISKVTENTSISENHPTFEEKINKKIICIDAGHGITLEKSMERLSPKSEKLKPSYTAGTKGKNLSEEQLNLILAKKLKQILENAGFEVLMTREVSNITLSNIERANLANNSGSVLSIHIHADWSDNPLTNGISVLIPIGDNLINPSIESSSKILGQKILTKTVEKTGAKNNGLSPRGDLTGLNWSEIPSVFIETGFMSNSNEDSLLELDEYQNKIVNGIFLGILSYLEGEKL